LNPGSDHGRGVGRWSISQLQVFFFSLLVASLLFFLWLWTGLLSNIFAGFADVAGDQLRLEPSAPSTTATLKSQLSEDTAKFLYAEGWYSGRKSRRLPRAALRRSSSDQQSVGRYKFQMRCFRFW